ncbi:hypothetical protein ABT071_14010 [Streptomyces sp. NPDC002506]|uniref:hypothetical protein n=1 Tax=Streptomyces sp. NPDC002506 TaxID=3154536 RepID=UPI00333188C9
MTNWLAGQKITAGGLNNDAGQWTAYTPTWTSSSGAAPSLGNGTLDGEYSLNGSTCTVRIALAGGSTTTWGGGQHRFALPFTAASLANANFGYIGSALGSDLGTAYYPGICRIFGAGTFVMLISPTTATGSAPAEWNATRPFTWGSGDHLSLEITYKPA